MTETIVREVGDFIVANFLFGQESQRPTPDQSFLESSIIDSTGILELVAFVEQRYHVSIADRELMPENLDSLNNLSAFVLRKMAQSNHDAA